MGAHVSRAYQSLLSPKTTWHSAWAVAVSSGSDSATRDAMLTNSSARLKTEFA